MTETKCFEVWADNIFLGYEYDVNSYEVLKKSKQKYSDPKKWNVIEYTVKQLTEDS